MIQKNTLLIIGVAILGILPLPAAAYIDPGSGSYLFQMLIAGILGGLFAMKVFWKKLVLFITRLLSKRNNKKKDET